MHTRGPAGRVRRVEYVILQKLRDFRESGSDRHLRDIANMRRISGHLIDQAALESWLHRLGLAPEWQRPTSRTLTGLRTRGS